jgi:hypothetical protein
LVGACAKAILDPATIERITAAATTAEKTFLLTIFHLQNSEFLYEICVLNEFRFFDYSVSLVSRRWASNSVRIRPACVIQKLLERDVTLKTSRSNKIFLVWLVARQKEYCARKSRKYCILSIFHLGPHDAVLAQVQSEMPRNA